jgi:hypothetical protein
MAAWIDLSGAGNHVTEIGGTTNISVARPVGAPAYIYGAPTAWMKFPVGILPSVDYTLFFVARYNGATRGRILQGIDINWFSGFHSFKAGVTAHGSILPDKCGWITYPDVSRSSDKHDSDWVIGTDRSNSFRSNGEDRTVRDSSNAVCDVFTRLAINTGFTALEKSDFAVQSVLVYNRRLTDSDVLRVEAWLNSMHPVFTPSNLQVRVNAFTLKYHQQPRLYYYSLTNNISGRSRLLRRA